MKSAWKDTTSYSRGECRAPREWTLEVGGLRLVVHHIHGLGDEWFGTCHTLGIRDRPLSADIELAKMEFVDLVREWVCRHARLLEKL